VGTFRSLDRIACTVWDINKAKAFFSDIFDMNFDAPIVDEKAGVTVNYSGFGIELVSPLPIDSPFGNSQRQMMEKEGEGGVRVVTIRVDNMDEAIEHIRKRGIEPVALLTIGKGREAVYNPGDFYGLPIVLCSYPQIHPMTAAVTNPDGTAISAEYVELEPKK
jgi:hypothetical protein